MPQETHFEIGDTVKVVNPAGDNSIVLGQTGVICEMHDPDFVGVNFNEYNIRLHSCEGKCEKGHGWNVLTHSLKLIKPVKPFGTIIKNGVKLIEGYR